jgi:hypothetical protein
MLLNSRMHYQQLLRNISVGANPQPKNVIFTGSMSVQLILSYNTPYIVNVTQHSTCQLLIWTAIIELNFSKLHDNYFITVQYVFLQISVVTQWN